MNPPTLIDLLIGSIPMLLLLGFMYAIISRFTASRRNYAEQLEELRKQSALLERIAATLETKAK